MKKNYLSAIVFLLACTFCKGQEVTAEQKMLITKITATWCPNCGTSSWDVKQDLVNMHGQDAIFLATHVSGSSDLFSSTARDYSENLPAAFGQPLFYLNREKYSTSSITSAVQEMAGQNTNQTPLANTGVEMELDGQVLDVKARVKFFQPADGEYYLSLFIIEDNVIANQSNRGSNVNHRKIFRGRVTAETFGELITNGSVEADQTFDFRFSRGLNPTWDTDQLEVAAVVWQKVGDNYEFVNVASVTQFSTFTSVNILEKEGVDVSVYPNRLSTQSAIQVTLPTSQSALTLELINANGQLVKQIFEGPLSQGKHTFPITKNPSVGKGIYFVRLEKEGSSITKKIIVD